MSLAEALAVVCFVAIIIYAVLGGADYGSGVWDLTAGGDRRGSRTRALVDHAIGPVWEANHVWLIFVLVVLWGGFPDAFAALMRDAAIPLWLAGLGIVARGAGFAFRKVAPSLGWARAAGVAFALSSVATPFFLGTVAGLVGSGRIGTDRSGTWAWLSPTPVIGGVLAVATCTFLAGVYLTAEADGLGQEGLAAELATKTLIGGVITGALALVAIPVLIFDSEELAKGLLGPAVPLILLSGVAGTSTMVYLWRRRLRPARVLATIAVAAVVAGWGAAQYPWMLVDAATIDEAAGHRSSLIAMLIASAVGSVLVLPAVVLLLHLADSNRVGHAS